MVANADENADYLELNEWANTINAFLRGFVDIVPGLGLQADRMYTHIQINSLEAEILSLRCQPYSKLKKAALKNKIKGLNNSLSKYADKAETVSKKGAYASFAITAISCSLQSIEEFVEYSAALKILSSYDYILCELMYCGDENIEYAAQTVHNDMGSVVSKYGTLGYDTLNNIGLYGSTAAASYYLAGLGVGGLALDLVWLITDVAVGDTIDNKIQNFLNVECANAFKMCSSKKMTYSNYRAGNDGKVYIITGGDSQSEGVRNIFVSAIFARKWAENIYYKNYSSSAAYSNVTYLGDLYEKY